MILGGAAMANQTFVMRAARWLVFGAFAALLVWGPFERTFKDAERYAYLTDIMPSDWGATNL